MPEPRSPKPLRADGAHPSARVRGGSHPTSTALALAVELDPAPDVDAERLATLVSSIVADHFLSGGHFELTLHIVDDPRIRALNAEHRGQDRHTDVLSFPLYEPDADFVLPPDAPVHLGDVVVSYPRAVEQADEYGHSVQRELAYLVAHGTLHLLGYDHEIESDRAVMRRREEDALGPLGLTR